MVVNQSVFGSVSTYVHSLLALSRLPVDSTVLNSILSRYGSRLEGVTSFSQISTTLLADIAGAVSTATTDQNRPSLRADLVANSTDGTGTGHHRFHGAGSDLTLALLQGRFGDLSGLREGSRSADYGRSLPGANSVGDFDFSRITPASYHSAAAMEIFRGANMNYAQTERLFRDLRGQGFRDREIHRAATDTHNLRIGGTPDAMARNTTHITHLNRRAPGFIPALTDIDTTHGSAYVAAETRARVLEHQLAEARRSGDAAAAARLEREATEARAGADRARAAVIARESEAAGRLVPPAERGRADSVRSDIWQRRNEDINRGVAADIQRGVSADIRRGAEGPDTERGEVRATSRAAEGMATAIVANADATGGTTRLLADVANAGRDDFAPAVIPTSTTTVAPGLRADAGQVTPGAATGNNVVLASSPTTPKPEVKPTVVATATPTANKLAGPTPT